MQNSSDHTSAQTHSRHEEEKWSSPQVARTQETETQQLLRIQLEQHIAELEQEKQILTERTHQAELSATINHALLSKLNQEELLQYCCNAILQHLNVSLVCIWTLEGSAPTLQIQAYAGNTLCLQEQEASQTIKALLLERVSKLQQPSSLTCTLEQTEEDILARQGFTFFAAYPLVCEEHMFGILSIFSCQAFSSTTLQALASDANAIANGLAHRRTDQEREHLLALAKNAQMAAEHAMESRKNFLSNIIHDLKSPLTSIIGSTQLLQHRIEKYQPPEREKYLQTIEIITASTRRMADMIGDLLDLARLQMGLKLELNHTEGDLLNLIRHVVNEYQQATTKHQLTIQTNCDCLSMIYDAPHIERMLANLLSNAIKYSPQGGEITITIAQQSSPEGKPCAIIHLQDHGIGIPDQDLPHIFEPFHRASNSEHNFQGTGLGLTSAKQIIAQHGGTITVTSEENQGTIFTILLPLHAA